MKPFVFCVWKGRCPTVNLRLCPVDSLTGTSYGTIFAYYLLSGIFSKLQQVSYRPLLKSIPKTSGDSQLLTGQRKEEFPKFIRTPPALKKRRGGVLWSLQVSLTLPTPLTDIELIQKYTRLFYICIRGSMLGYTFAERTKKLPEERQNCF